LFFIVQSPNRIVVDVTLVGLMVSKFRPCTYSEVQYWVTFVQNARSPYMDSSLRDERLPEGPRFASESLDADTGSRSASLKLTHYLCYERSENSASSVGAPCRTVTPPCRLRELNGRSMGTRRR